MKAKRRHNTQKETHLERGSQREAETRCDF